MGEELDRWLLLILAGVVAVSLLPSDWHLWSRNGERITALARMRTRRGG